VRREGKRDDAAPRFASTANSVSPNWKEKTLPFTAGTTELDFTVSPLSSSVDPASPVPPAGKGSAFVSHAAAHKASHPTMLADRMEASSLAKRHCMGINVTNNHSWVP